MANDEPIDWEDEVQRLKEELAKARRELSKGSKKLKKSVSKARKDITKALDIDYDFGESLEVYLGSIIDSVAHGLDTALSGVFIANPIFAATKGKRKRTKIHLVDEQHLDQFYADAPSILGLLSDTNRLRLLKNLEEGPQHQDDLVSDKLQPSTFKHHIYKLIEEGWVVHEKARGRYVLSHSGKEALKFAEVLFVLSKPELFQQKEDITAIEDDDYEIIEN